jgi:hypothetical protein
VIVESKTIGVCRTLGTVVLIRCRLAIVLFGADIASANLTIATIGVVHTLHTLAEGRIATLVVRAIQIGLAFGLGWVHFFGNADRVFASLSWLANNGSGRSRTPLTRGTDSLTAKLSFFAIVVFLTFGRSFCRTTSGHQDLRGQSEQ